MQEKQVYLLVKRRWWHLFTRKDTYIDAALADADNDPVGFLNIKVPILKNRRTQKTLVPSCFIDVGVPLSSAENTSCLSEVTCYE